MSKTTGSQTLILEFTFALHSPTWNTLIHVSTYLLKNFLISYILLSSENLLSMASSWATLAGIVPHLLAQNECHLHIWLLKHMGCDTQPVFSLEHSLDSSLLQNRLLVLIHLAAFVSWYKPHSYHYSLCVRMAKLIFSNGHTKSLYNECRELKLLQTSTLHFPFNTMTLYYIMQSKLLPQCKIEGDIQPLIITSI